MVFYEMLARKAREDREKYGDRLPPGQRKVENWPVFTYGPTPRIDLQKWTFRIWGLVEQEITFTWEEFTALPEIAVVADMHCVTQWTRFDNRWEGVGFQELMRRAHVKPEASHVMIHCYGGYTTNLPLDDLARDDVLFAYRHNGEDLPVEHGWPLRLVVPHLYGWKSAKWVRGIEFMDKDKPGFWETYGYHMRGDPWKEERYA